VSLAELGAKRARRDLPAMGMEATVLSPALTDDGFLRVQVDSQKGTARECPWTPHPDEEPLPGAAALVIESDQGNLWCVAWWSQ
jgi:uridylate kinase